MNDAIVQNGTEHHCLGVHYVVGVVDARTHFSQAGFRGIRRLQMIDVDLGCNEARRRVNDMAARGQGVAFFQGAWDYAPTNRCAIFAFDFDSYDGPRQKGAQWADHADYGGD